MNCPVCECPQGRLKWRLKDRLGEASDEAFSLRECAGCGLLFQDGVDLGARIADFYPPGYWWDGKGTLAPLERRYREWVMSLDQLRFVRTVVPQAGDLDLLDIGCGTGLFVRLAARAGYRAVGVESSAEAAAAAARLGDEPVIHGNESTVAESGRRFDVVTLFHVLEHVPDPFDFLRRIRKLLVKPGHLVVQVPNRSSIQARLFGPRWHGLDCPRHICNYTTYALLYILGRAGFRIRRLRHFSLRDNAPAVVSSLFPALDPLARKVRARRRGRGGRWGDVVAGTAYLGLVCLAQPGAWVEAKLGRGGSLMVHASWD